MSPKNPKCLTLQEKSCIIEEFRRGVTVRNLSMKYGVAKSTICKIKTQRQMIYDSTAGVPGKRRTKRFSITTNGKNIIQIVFEDAKQKYDYYWSNDERKSPGKSKINTQNKNTQIKETNSIEFTASERWFQSDLSVVLALDS
ncbi:homeobox-like domain superfamily [Holotrichia oblita]|uniref:Homeobox-like domain superfamily n=1 Tax=Holotrichia oblita TaxID=644536 RepID=A0ACB9THL9_HOLOL|nr:homeobox-like domain superfamily [Holotrichia oblita]